MNSPKYQAKIVGSVNFFLLTLFIAHDLKPSRKEEYLKTAMIRIRK